MDHSWEKRQSPLPAGAVGAVAEKVACIQNAVRHTLRRLSELSASKKDDRPRRDGTEHLM